MADDVTTESAVREKLINRISYRFRCGGSDFACGEGKKNCGCGILADTILADGFVLVASSSDAEKAVPRTPSLEMMMAGEGAGKDVPTQTILSIWLAMWDAAGMSFEQFLSGAPEKRKP